MTDSDLRDIATAHGLTLYRRTNGERAWHDMREGALLAFARAVERRTLERAAEVAFRAGRPVGAGDGDTYVSGTAAQAADAIRALKEGVNG